MAQSWERLIIGKDIQKHDLTLLDHRFYELILITHTPGISHEKPHESASEMYNYQKESQQFYGSG